MVQYQPQPMQQPDPWAGQMHTPGVDRRQLQQAVYPRPEPQPQPGYQLPVQPVQAGQFNQPFIGSDGMAGSGPKPSKPTTRKSSKGAKGTKGSKGCKGPKGPKGSKGFKGSKGSR